MAYEAPPIGGKSFRHQPVGIWRLICRGAPAKYALGAQCTLGASGVREKPPRGGRRGDLEEEPVCGLIPKQKQGLKPERRLSGGVFTKVIIGLRNPNVVTIGSIGKHVKEILRAGGEGGFTERIFMRHRGTVEARDGSARSAEAWTEMSQLATTAPASSFIGSVRGADGSSGGTGDASMARSAASSEAVADGIADPDEDGNGSGIVTALGTTAVAITITITITNRYGVIDDPVHVRDGHHHGDGTGDGRIDVATGNGAEHRAGGAEVEDEAAAAEDETRSFEVVACGSAREERGPRRADAALLSVIRLTRSGEPVCRRWWPGRRGWR